ncbi:MAG: flagellin FliC [Methylobacter sp.]|nr:MAG: flagellin FliC [Methylobacter sp.]PPD03870.1 MAG: flagellin FliC [Methylobacter sp.]PPD21375.1 MAG: flagellin FliC [Methylobacter sp.]
MALTVNTNISSISAQRSLNSSTNDLQTSLQRLSSGLRVNSARDDASGLAIANRINSQIRGSTVAVRNANDGISVAQTADGALAAITDTLQRQRDLAVQAANGGVVTSSDRQKLQTEFKQLGQEIDRIIKNTTFNGKQILNGSLNAGAVFQVGANTATDNQITFSITSTAKLTGLSAVLGTNNGLSIGSAATVTNIRAVIDKIDLALNNIDTTRATLGAVQNRFTTTISNLNSSIENQSASRSRIIDADFASETANLSRNQILQQAGTAILSQANQSNQGVLSLLR